MQRDEPVAQMDRLATRTGELATRMGKFAKQMDAFYFVFRMGGFHILGNADTGVVPGNNANWVVCQ